jgi:hypothetical protein
MQDIRPLIEKFVSDLEAVWRADALRILSESLGKNAGHEGQSPPAKRGKPGPKPGSKRKAGKAAKPAATKASSSADGRKARRGKTEIDALANKIVAYVKAHPASRAEQIKKALGITGKYEWLAPIGRLLESNRLVSAGQKRSTTYSVGK